MLNCKNVISNAHELLDIIVTFLLPPPLPPPTPTPIRLSGEGVSPVNICEYDILCVSWCARGWDRGGGTMREVGGHA